MHKKFELLRIFKFSVQSIFAVFTGYLLYQEIVLFASVPIHTTKYERAFSAEHFPDLIVCPVPGINVSVLQSHGYKDSYKFLLGEINNKKSGWIGKDANKSVTDLVKEAAVWSTEDNCPFVKLTTGKFTCNQSDQKLIMYLSVLNKNMKDRQFNCLTVPHHM